MQTVLGSFAFFIAVSFRICISGTQEYLLAHFLRGKSNKRLHWTLQMQNLHWTFDARFVQISSCQFPSRCWVELFLRPSVNTQPQPSSWYYVELKCHVPGGLYCQCLCICIYRLLYLLVCVCACICECSGVVDRKGPFIIRPCHAHAVFHL